MSQADAEYFPTLGLRPHLGRFFTSSDMPFGSGDLAPALDEKIRVRSGSPRKTIRVEGVPLTIIGVAPEGFGGLVIDVADEVTIPFGFRDPAKLREKTYLGLEAYARLQPGVSVRQAQAELDSLWPAIRAESLPPTLTGPERRQFLSRKLSVQSAATGSSFLRSSYRQPLLILMSMVGALLLIACVNLANLMLARAASRNEEFTIRVALGASRWQLVRQILIESLMLSGVGALTGLLFSLFAARYLLSTMWSGFVPSSLKVNPDARVLVFTALAAMLTTVIFGLYPALRVGAMAETSRSVRGGFRGARWMVSGQIAISFTLAVMALLFTGSLNRLHRTDTGFLQTGLLVVQTYPLYGAEAQHIPGRAAYYRELASRLSGLPGVEAASYSHMGPLLRYELKSPASVTSTSEISAPAVYELTGPGFFELVGMRVLQGRDFSWSDDESKPAVAIISESLARRLFPSGDAVGRRIDFGDKNNLEVVGVVNSASLWMPESREPLAVYRAFLQEPEYNAPHVDLRVQGSPSGVSAAVRRTLESLGYHTALRTQTIEERAERLLATQHLAAVLASFFGGMAVLLAAIGLYGILSQAVTSRTGEIGIRMAIGARPADICWLVVREVLLMLFSGALLGLPAIWATSRLVASSIYGVSPAEPEILLAAFASLAVAAVVAAYVPARRAVAVNPVDALR